MSLVTKTERGSQQQLIKKMKLLEEDRDRERARANKSEQERDELREKMAAESLATECEKQSGGPSWKVQEEMLEQGESLGSGGWGEVKEAKLRVAAKYMRKCLKFDSPSKNKFRREMNVMARVNHPNCLRFIGAILGNEMVILTELMTTSLHKRIHTKDEIPLSSPQCFTIAIDVARALNYLHSISPVPIIHRDLSSSNILLRPSYSNGGWLAKVSDYGTANFQDKVKTENPGAKPYEAPESNDPSKQTPKMDIYSFGRILIEMFSGELPLHQCQDDLMKKLDDTNLKNLITRCLGHDIASRPTADQLVVDLQGLRPESTPGPSLS